MIETLQQFLAGLPVDRTTLIIIGLALGIFLVVLGIFYPVPDTARIARRMAAARVDKPEAQRAALLRDTDYSPTGMMKALVPLESRERGEIATQLAHAGFHSRMALAYYFLLRFVIGLIVPLGFGLVYLVAVRTGRVADLGPFVAGLDAANVVQIVAGMILVGFYGPAYLLRARVANRRMRIEQAFPNALDLMKIAIEAGMGFDAAMTRVAQELHEAAPELSREIIDAQREILAGRDRTRAYLAMAERLGIEEARSFVALLLQSIQFGTSAAHALTVYSEEMRQRRELRAQEKANKLPVQMSAVMAFLMLPALLLVSVGPAITRYMSFMEVAN